MSRFNNPFVQYFDIAGKPIVGGTVSFYEPGTVTFKTIYSNSALSTPAQNPSLTDDNGMLPDIYLKGIYKAILRDADGVIIDEADPIGGASTGGQFERWDPDVIYNDSDVVIHNIDGEYNEYFSSLSESNIGNDPQYSPASWEAVRFLTNGTQQLYGDKYLNNRLFVGGAEVFGGPGLSSSAYGRSQLLAADASASQTLLGISTYLKSLLPVADASAAQTVLGISTFVKTLLDDPDILTALTTLAGAAPTGTGGLVRAQAPTINNINLTGTVTGGLDGATIPNPLRINSSSTHVWPSGWTVIDLGADMAIARTPSNFYLVVGLARNSADSGWVRLSGSDLPMLVTLTNSNFGIRFGSGVVPGQISTLTNAIDIGPSHINISASHQLNIGSNPASGYIRAGLNCFRITSLAVETVLTFNTNVTLISPDPNAYSVIIRVITGCVATGIQAVRRSDVTVYKDEFITPYKRVSSECWENTGTIGGVVLDNVDPEFEVPVVSGGVKCKWTVHTGGSNYARVAIVGYRV